jgi:hypothetical protein
MRKWLSWLMLTLWFIYPVLASAQTEIHLSKLKVQLCPEFDQPSMLVLYDFEVTAATPLPARVTFRIPRAGNLIAVAAMQNGELVNPNFEGPSVNGDSKTFTLIVDSLTTYHFEYYQPLVRRGELRQFSYAWAGDYAVDEFTIRVQQPLDTTSFVTQPPLKPSVDSLDGLTYYVNQPINLPAGQRYVLDLEYAKTSDALTVPASTIQPSGSLDENTAGRITAGDYIPYLILVVGILLIMAGIGYYYMSGRIRRFKPRRLRAAAPESRESDVYCHQCGQRARAGDRFCRVCGTRLRPGA